jgi:propanol-preferring alcohol dehydrogenase
MLLVVGLPAESLCFPPILMAALEVRIQASSVGTREDVREVLDMAAEGKVRCQASARRLAEVNEVMRELREGRVAGRVVLTPR